jgi:hypothetical protein
LIKNTSGSLTHGLARVIPIKFTFFDYQSAAATAVKPEVFLVTDAPAAGICKKIRLRCVNPMAGFACLTDK